MRDELAPDVVQRVGSLFSYHFLDGAAAKKGDEKVGWEFQGSREEV
jgi:hypothetical protein